MSERQLRRGIRPGRRPLTCYHEAGHCLARWWFGHFFSRVLVLTMEDVARGVYQVTRSGVPMVNAEGFMDGYALPPAVTPGMLADMGGTPDDVAQHRRAAVIDVEMGLIENFIGGIAEARYRKCGTISVMLGGGAGDLDRARRTLDTWFSDPETGRMAAIQARQRAAALVRSEAGWRAITALATALMERGELQWCEAEPLLAVAYGHERPGQTTWISTWPPSLDMIRNGQFPKQKRT